MTRIRNPRVAAELAAIKSVPKAVRLADRAARLGAVTKWCPGCGTAKLAPEFASNANRKDGLQHYCRPCDSEFKRERYAADPEAARERSRERNRRYRARQAAQRAAPAAA